VFIEVAWSIGWKEFGDERFDGRACLDPPMPCVLNGDLLVGYAHLFYAMDF
jgi:hypothetical protein